MKSFEPIIELFLILLLLTFLIAEIILLCKKNKTQKNRMVIMGMEITSLLCSILSFIYVSHYYKYAANFEGFAQELVFFIFILISVLFLIITSICFILKSIFNR